MPVLIRVISICLCIGVDSFLHDMMDQDFSLIDVEVPAFGIVTEGVAMREFSWGTMKAAAFALQQRRHTLKLKTSKAKLSGASLLWITPQVAPAGLCCCSHLGSKLLYSVLVCTSCAAVCIPIFTCFVLHMSNKALDTGSHAAELKSMLQNPL